jgi:hypothetical protein
MTDEEVKSLVAANQKLATKAGQAAALADRIGDRQALQDNAMLRIEERIAGLERDMAVMKDRTRIDILSTLIQSKIIQGGIVLCSILLVVGILAHLEPGSLPFLDDVLSSINIFGE